MITDRREFLKLAPGILALPASLALARELRADVVIIGGGTGGVAAALAALRSGMSVIMTEETRWLGGQLTSQGVPPDEHPWIEMFGCTQSYRDYRNGVRGYYRRHYPLTDEARRRPALNPGDGSVSRITHEPRISAEVLQNMLSPYLSGGKLTVLAEHAPVSAEAEAGRVRSVTVRSRLSGRDRTLHGRYFLDATEQGDLLPLTGTEYVTGFESRRQTGEPHAPEEAQPANIQAFTVCFAIEYLPDQDHTIEKPAQYAFWRDYVPQLRPPWPGRLLSWSMSDPITLKPRRAYFDPSLGPGQGLNLFVYRRIANRGNFAPGAFASDISLVNWPQNDYWLGNLHEVSPAEKTKHLEGGRQLSLSLLYWMQTEAPRPDGGQGWKGLRLRTDVLGTEDGLAMYPYIRESRRIQAEFTVVEQQVGTDARMQLTGKKREELTAEEFPDSVGVGSYRIDLHPSTGGDNYIDVSSLPFQIPLGSLIPKRMENLIPACKNLGVTHITNGCYRLHPVEWNVGEAAGLLAAFAIRSGQPPRSIRNTPKLLADFQAEAGRQGVQTAWPRLSPR